MTYAIRQAPTRVRKLSRVRRLLIGGSYEQAEREILALRGTDEWPAPEAEIIATAVEVCASCADAREDRESHLAAAARAQSLEQRRRDRVLALLGIAARARGTHDAAATAPRRSSAPAATAVAVEDAPRFAIHCLGPLQVYLDDAQIGPWTSRRSRSVFKYLVAHRTRPVPKDVLMDVFWPEAAPEAARNSLHVAIHGLRRTLRAAGDAACPVLFRDDAYTLDPESRAWVDREEFETLIASARRAADAGRVEDAMRDRRAALALYEGDLFDDDPYEEWMIPSRRWLREAYLSLLQELSRHLLGRGDHAECLLFGQMIVSADPCREDARRDLMRAYARQGQWHLAIRQYRDCVKALRLAVGGQPAPQTTELHERILRREPV